MLRSDFEKMWIIDLYMCSKIAAAWAGPSSARILSPSSAARWRMPGSLTAVVMAWASFSAVRRLEGMGGRPTPSLAQRQPQKLWSSERQQVFLGWLSL